ncbi:MAG: hypothetical protein WCO06_06065 [Candidatus Roizmanbacteria bacterium]
MNLKENSLFLRKFAFGMLVVLLGEFLFGIYTTLYVHFPENASTKELWKFSSQDLYLNIHMILGVLITIGAIIFFIRVITKKQNNWLLSSVIALLGIVIATIGGIQFVPTQLDIYSIIMSVGFTIALGGYLWGIYTNSN